MNYFEATVSVRQETTDIKGNVKIKKVRKYYLVDALTVTEAEARVVKIFEEMGGAKEYQVLGINGSRVVDLMVTDGEDNLFEAIVEISLEGENVKKVKETYLVESPAIKDVQTKIENVFKKNGYSQEYEVIAIKKSKIAELVDTDTTELKDLKLKLMKFKVQPPVGYDFADGSQEKVVDLEGLKDLVINLSDDSEFQQAIHDLPEDSMSDYCKRILELNGFSVEYI